MTDQELLDLVQAKTPDELSLEEIDLLRTRLAESIELREALYGQMQMEAYLAEALARVHFTPQDIIARANGAQSRFQLTVPLVCVILAVPIFLLLATALWNAMTAKKTEVAENSKAAVKQPAEKQKGEAKGGAAKIKPTENDAAAGKQGDAQKSPAKVPDQTSPHGPNNPAGPSIAAPAPPPVVKDPWQEVMAAQGEMPLFQEVAFQDFDTAKSLPRRADLQRWFEPVPGQNYRIVETDTQRGRCGVLEGSARLRAPWTKDSAFKFAIENYKGLVLHFYHGQEGVTLAYYQDAGDKWAAWKTTRKAGSLRPETLALTATDDDRGRRTEVRFGGPMEIRWRDGELIFSRGDVVLLTAPLAEMPEDVYFEGRATFLGIAVKRTRDDPGPPQPSPVVYETNKPAELPWQFSKPDGNKFEKLPDSVKFEKLPDGSVRLASDKDKVQAFVPLPYAGLGELIFELDGVTPGAGVYLGKEQGMPQEIVRLTKNTRDGRLGVKMTYPDDAAEFDLGTLADRVMPTAAQHCWIKLLIGCGNFRWWVSCDGKHWAQPEMAIDNAPGNRTFLGLHVVANRPGVQLTLKRVEFRELAGLSALAAKEVREKAPAIATAPTLGFWLAEVARRQPAGVDAADWRRACAIRSLGIAPPRELAYHLLELLLDDAAARKLPLAAQLAALDDAALLVWDFRDAQAMKVSMGRRYLELGQRKYEEEGLPPWSSIRKQAMSVPVATWLQQPAIPDVNLRWELIQAASRHQSDDTLRLLRQIRFFQQQQHAPLADWAETSARRDLPGRAAGDLATRLKDSWRHPLVEELSKETYNSLTELQAVLESEAWQDAARMVTSLDPEAAPGVAPYHKDKNLLVSLPVAVRLTLTDYPQLRQALGQQFGTLAKLRIGQAMAGGDAPALELATVQFAGTEAAAEAHRWLGDRALSSGWFERAISQYRRSTQIQPAFSGDISPRLRLAAAMLGQEAEQPVTRAVAFGEVKMTKEQFEALVAEMRARGNSSLASVAAAAPQAPLNPVNFQVNFKAKLDGPLGANPQEEVGRRTNQFRVPWVDRQIATALEGDILYVSNRFQLAAYNLASGQRVWQSAAPPGAMAKAQDWATIPMQPLVTQSHVYTRLLYGASPLLCCYEKASGKIVWNSPQRDREFLVSDPVLVQGQLVALSITLLDQQEGQLKWNAFDPQTGEIASQKDLIRLRSTWGSRGCCEIRPLEDSVVAVLGGVTFSCDAAGNLKWIRRQVVLPADEEPRWILQLYQRPLVEDSRLYVAQPGVRAVDCLDVQSGARQWMSVIPDLVNVIGLAEDKLLVRTETDVRALEKTTGKLVWRRDLADLHSFAVVSGKSLLVAQREPVPMQNNVIHNRLSWIDIASGEVTATTILPSLNDPDPRLGPIVQYKDRLWTFFGKGQHEPARDLIELAPSGEAEKQPAALAGLEQLWSRSVPPNQQLAARKFFADWQLIASSPGDRTGLIPEVHGEKDLLGLRATAQSPVVFARTITLPAGGKPRLRIRVGNDPGQNWKLAVFFGDKQLHAVDITDKTHPDRYKQLEIDLSPVAGQSGNLVVQAQFVSTGDATALFWKALEVVF